MNTRLLLLTLPILFLTGSARDLLGISGQPSPDPESTEQAIGLQAFVGAVVIDGTGAPPIQDGVVLVRDGIIESVGTRSSVPIPAGAEVIDIAGRWLIPGLINAHGHISGSREAVLEQLGIYAHYGVTTVISLGGVEDAAIVLRNEQKVPTLNRSRVFAAGPVLNPTSPEMARSEVARVHAMGVDWVKIRVDGGANPGGNKMSPEIYGALIDEARIRGLPVAIHIWELDDAKGVVAAGGAMVAHSVRDFPVDVELTDMMRERGVCLVPTLTRELSTFVYADRPAFFDDPFFLEKSAPADLDGFLTPARQDQARGAGGTVWRERLPTAQANVLRTHQAGVRVAMGTDTGASLPGRFLGYFEHVEMEMMVEAGLTPSEVLVSATGVSAACVGLEDQIGSVRAGRWADFVVLGADPTAHILNARQIESVWVAGNRVR